MATAAFVAAVVMSTARSDASDRSAAITVTSAPTKLASPRRSEPRDAVPARTKPRLPRLPTSFGKRAPWDPSPSPTQDSRNDAKTDAAARVQFTEAFDAQARDDAWAGATEAAIADAIETTEGRLELRAAECRATLCRVELRGDRDALPSIAPFDGVTWWLVEDDDDATLLIVRDGAELPLPADPETAAEG